VYGKDKTETITSLCRNKIFFAGADEETSDYCSQNLGYQENEEVKEGISYGANEIRDGVSLSTQKNLRRVVIASEIMNMKALEAYLKFAGHFPIAKISFKIKKRPKIAERFVDILPIANNQNLIEVVEEENLAENEDKETEQLSLLDYEESFPDEDLEEGTEEEESFIEDDESEDDFGEETEDEESEEDDENEGAEADEDPKEKTSPQQSSRDRPDIF
jgi:hypothetical protein